MRRTAAPVTPSSVPVWSWRLCAPHPAGLLRLGEGRTQAAALGPHEKATRSMRPFRHGPVALGTQR
jgi:hypothetical protein